MPKGKLDVNIYWASRMCVHLDATVHCTTAFGEAEKEKCPAHQRYKAAGLYICKATDALPFIFCSCLKSQIQANPCMLLLLYPGRPATKARYYPYDKNNA